MKNKHSMPKAELLHHIFSLEDLLEQLATEKSQQKDFWTFAAHQMQQPITQMQNKWQMYQLSGKTPHLGHFNKDLQNLSGLLAQFFQFQRWHTSGIQLNMTMQDAFSWGKSVIQKYKGTSRDIRFIPLSSDPFWTTFDQHIITFTAETLIENALRHTKPPAQIWLGIKQQQQSWKIIISDTGNGMSPESKKNIFTPFKKDKDTAKGFGLGAALAKKAVESHQGEITCESVQGLGTKFTIILPIHAKAGNKTETIKKT